VITHTVIAAGSGLAILADASTVNDLDGTTGGVTTVNCFLEINGGSSTKGVTVGDDGSAQQGASSSTTDVASAPRSAPATSSASAAPPRTWQTTTKRGSNADLLIEHVAS
jgi:hypothetical protein